METAASPKKSLGAIRRKAVDLQQFKPVVETPFAEGQALPLVITPAAEQVDLADWAGNNRDYVQRKLEHHGGILFRGFDLKTSADFERVVTALYRQVYGEYGDLPREGVSGKIYSSTPYPDDKPILFHNEGSHMGRWPTRISFFCVVAAKEMGASPIVDCRRVYQQLDPLVREAFESKGLMYVRNFSEGLDVSWQHFFRTDDRRVVEEGCAKQGAICEWVGDSHLRVKQKCLAVRRHPRTGEKAFFNQVQLHHVHCVDPETRASLLSIFKREDLPRHVYFGDGSEISDATMDHVGEIYERNAVRSLWREGDLITLDNMLTAHGRDPFVGPRKIVVGLGDIVSAEEMDRQAAASP